MHNAIFAGGTGDGFAEGSGDSMLSPYSQYMLAAGVFGLDAAPLADVDSDGWVNLLEFAFGSHPAQGASTPSLETRRADPGGGELLVLAYPRRSGGIEAGAQYAADGVIYDGEGTLRFDVWQEIVQHRAPPSGLPAGYEWGAISKPAISMRGFLRVTVEME